MPLVTRGIKTRSQSCIISQSCNSHTACLGQVIQWSPLLWLPDVYGSTCLSCSFHYPHQATCKRRACWEVKWWVLAYQLAMFLSLSEPQFTHSWSEHGNACFTRSSEWLAVGGFRSAQLLLLWNKQWDFGQQWGILELFLSFRNEIDLTMETEQWIRGLLSLLQFKFSREILQIFITFFFISLSSPSESTLTNQKMKKETLQSRNNLGFVSWVISFIYSPVPSVRSASLHSVSCPLEATLSLVLLRVYIRCSLFMKCPSPPYLLEQLKPDLLYLPPFMIQDWKPNLQEKMSFLASAIEIKDRSWRGWSCKGVNEERDLQEGEDHAQRAEKEKSFLTTELETWG